MLSSIREIIPFCECFHIPKMDIVQFDRDRFTLVISGEVADLVIRKASTVIPNRTGWIVDWKIKKYLGYKPGTQETFNLGNTEVEQIFGLTGIIGHADKKIKEAVQELLKLPE